MKILARFVAYQLAAWLAIAVVARVLWWGAALVVGLLALYSTIPLILFIKWRGWPFYPGALFRLLVVRVVLYAQLLLPFAGGAAAIGMLVGLVFGQAVLVGATLTGVVVAIAGLVLLAGYFGSRRLVVREVEAHVPGLPSAFDGARIAQISDLHVG